MLNKKRALVSLGMAIFIFVNALFLILLTWKLLNGPLWMTTAIVWIVAWPLMALTSVVTIPYCGTRALISAMLLGIAVDVLLLSGLTDGALSVFSKKSLEASTPPPPSPSI